MRRGMNKTIRAAARPLVTAAEDAARQQLPKSGGLNELVADRHTTISILTGANTAGVRLKRARKDAASYQSNRGFIYHKTFGEEPWRREEIPAAAGWWSDTMATGSRAVTPLIIAEMNRVGRIIQSG